MKNAALYLRTGHPSLRQAWEEFALNVETTNDPNMFEVAELANVPRAEVLRAVIRTKNNLPAVKRPLPINQKAQP